MIVLDLSILNQKGTPMFNSDIFANRPAFGIVGRIFISTDTAAIYRDTGTAWDLIADGGSASTNIYNSNGTLSGNRTVSSGGFNLTFNPSTTFDTTLTAANNASSLALFGVNRLSYAAAFSANNIGALYGGASSFALQTFAGSATFANSNVASGGSSVNSIDFSSAGSTITMTQSTGIRAMTGQQNLFQYQGTNSGTITHAAISQNTGFYRPTAATGILTITNAYSHLINALDDYGSGFIFTNRFGIYQAGASDINYFAAKTLIGSALSSGGGTGKLIVGSSTADNGIQIFGADSPSLRIDNAQSGGTQRFLIGLATSTNNYIQGSSAGQFCITTASSGAILFGMWQSINASEVMRISTASNLIIGSTTDAGFKLDVNGTARVSGAGTFTGNVTTGDQILIGSLATLNGAINFIKTNSSPVASRITFGTDGTGYKFAIAKNVSSTITDLFTLQDNGEATFNGSIAINNSVAAAVAAPSTHKVSILIGGVQYYLLASNV